MQNLIKNNGLTSSFIVAFVLFLLIIFRLLFKIDNYWIQVINLIGLLLAMFDVFVNVKRIYQKRKKFNLFTGFYFTIILTIIVLIVSVIFHYFNINEKWSDLITLITIFISLPEPLHIKMIGKILK